MALGKKVGVTYRYGNVKYTASEHERMREGQDKYGRDLLQPIKKVDRLTRKEIIDPDFVRAWGNSFRDDRSTEHYEIEQAKGLYGDELETGRKKPKSMSELTKELREKIDKDFTRFFTRRVFCVQDITLVLCGKAGYCMVCSTINSKSGKECWICGKELPWMK